MFTAEGNSDQVEPGGRTVVFLIPASVPHVSALFSLVSETTSRRRTAPGELPSTRTVMDLPGESETRRRDGRRNPAVINRRKPPVDTLYAVGIICLQVLSSRLLLPSSSARSPSPGMHLARPRAPCLSCEVSDPADCLTAGFIAAARLKPSDKRFQEAATSSSPPWIGDWSAKL
ncbi:inactive tyrosine-protein kinase 7 [Lates japonicus]|uniref:Inactive tyrosine-protein kinase 7 n=1 Tax=Lates japonicus TaxID=270547 RepID=A0AAD3MML6_LATJO|nr:inactive tyrosine-protein kinase 7 [Lates japonicus]